MIRPHATLSPSAAERWIQCPGSVLATQGLKEEPSVYAAEGTQAHDMAEIAASHVLGLDEKSHTTRLGDWFANWDESWGGDDEQKEMLRHADAYAKLLADHADHLDMPTIYLERTLNTGIPGCWGTADCVMVSPERFVIADYKYGRGFVAAKGNPQLMLYALGALHTFGDVADPKLVTLLIFQPRIDNVSAHTMQTSELLQWRDTIVPVAEQALEPGAPFNPSVTACRWCPLSGRCNAQKNKILSADYSTNPAMLSPEELADSLDRIAEVKQWLSDTQKVAADRAYSHGDLPRWKAVRANKRRVVKDHRTAIERLLDAGYGSEVTENRLAPFGKLDRLVGKEKLADILGDVLGETEGSISLAHEEDKRPGVGPNTEARQVFSTLE